MAKEHSNTGTTNTTPNSCVDCKVAISRRVIYEFRTAQWDKPKDSELTLQIPVAVAVNGKILPEYNTKAGVFKAKTEYEFWVEPGQKVSLYLNSDADPVYRESPVFEITPNERDIKIVVFEKRGKLGELDKPIFKATHEPKVTGGRKYDEYEAILSGDTWKKVSHEYTAEEAKGMIASGTTLAVREAVMSIYQKTLKGSLVIKNPDPLKTITVEFEIAENPRDNITGFNLHNDGLTRVHPLAWLAVIEAAQIANVQLVKTTSAWRPNYGSIAHRTGLALDVNHLDNTRLNRHELRGKESKNTNVSNEEIQLFKAKEAADQEAALAKTEFKIHETALAKFQAAGKPNPEKLAELQQSLANAKDKRDAAVNKQNEAKKTWDKERDKHEPVAVKAFRTSLLGCKGVSQVFDPWFMDINTHDAIAPIPNLQKSGNETLHDNHLHVSISNPRLST
ncbi:hypothetical protein [Undibacterium sp.]|uniref:hypothetical protein n=1 Tax=Undibacterium sp. TaxID=1914977 RepID=UPI0025DEB621|nr:hypothetical protein [Undibacterium sp.]